MRRRPDWCACSRRWRRSRVSGSRGGFRRPRCRLAHQMSGFVALPRRWVVERTLSWLMRSRRLARDYESRPESSEAAVLWSMTMLMGRRLARHFVDTP
ncbi:transposase [Streptomyces sp. NPDC007988]|uniref:transposase n=1 Tax=Streptomyces sp. NPDC007988 TaxID=3364802 RepID=UPI0036EB0A5D